MWTKDGSDRQTGQRNKFHTESRDQTSKTLSQVVQPKLSLHSEYAARFEY